MSMINQMPGGRGEPQWTGYEEDGFSDLEYRFADFERNGVTHTFMMMRGVTAKDGELSITVPENRFMMKAPHRGGTNGITISFTDYFEEGLEMSSDSISVLSQRMISYGNSNSESGRPFLMIVEIER